MYDWKDLSKMYKDEAERLHLEIEHALEKLRIGEPNCVPKAIGYFENILMVSGSNLDFIESFESKNATKNVSPKKKSGDYINVNSVSLTEEEVNKVEELISKIFDPSKKIHRKIELYCFIAVEKWLKEKGNIVTIDKMKENVVTVMHKEKKFTRTVKVLCSAMEFSGKTKLFGSDMKEQNIDTQRSYLIDPNEQIYDTYIFADYIRQDGSINLYAWVKGEFIQKMFFDPIRERFKGKMACILQKMSYNNSVGFPCAIDELLKRG